LTRLVSRHRPDAIAVERVFADVNVLSVMGTAQASAVAMLVAARHGIPVHLHTPTEVKASVTGNGRADKAQVTAMVTRLLRLPTAPTPADAADALALAICHLWRGAATNRIEQAAAAVRAQQATAAVASGSGRTHR
jgi:crossover junction endodeoxyribonuclease RuvC